VGRHGAIHGSNATNETDTKNEPWVSSHESEAPTVHVQGARRNANHSNSEASVHKRIVEVFALKRRHTAVFTGLAVEDEVDA